MARASTNGTRGRLAVFGLGMALSLTAPACVNAAGVTYDNAHSVSAYLLQRGIEAFEAKKTSKAIDFLEQAVVANPKNARAFAYLGKSHESAGRRDRAVKHFETALAIDPDDLKALQWAGEAALTQDRREDAEKNLERLRRLCKERCAEFRTLNTAIQSAEKPAQP